MLDYRPGSTGAFTVAIGLGGVLLSNSSSDSVNSTSGGSIAASPIGEVFFYPNRKASAIAFNVRVGSANSFYVAPGIFYVSRPKGILCGRIGLMAPIGGGALPVLPEIALGFRF